MDGLSGDLVEKFTTHLIDTQCQCRYLVCAASCGCVVSNTYLLYVCIIHGEEEDFLLEERLT